MPDELRTELDAAMDGFGKPAIDFQMLGENLIKGHELIICIGQTADLEVL